MWKRILIMFAVFVLVVGGIAFYKYKTIMAGMAQGGFAPPPTAVTSIVAKKET